MIACVDEACSNYTASYAYDGPVTVACPVCRKDMLPVSEEEHAARVAPPSPKPAIVEIPAREPGEHYLAFQQAPPEKEEPAEFEPPTSLD